MLTKITTGKTFIIYGLSTDTKPTEGVENGSVFYEMDTHNVFMFDGENVQWLEQ